MKGTKYVYCVIVSALCIMLFSFPCVAFADNSDGIEDSSQTQSLGTGTIEQPTIIVQTAPSVEPVGLSESPTTSVLRITASDTSGLHSVILRLIGDYNPIVTDHVYQQSGSYTSHHVEVTPDWSWIASALIFAIVLYSFFRIIGSLFGGK